MKKFGKIIILLFCIYSSFFVLASLSAPILSYFQNYELSAKLTSLFIYSCHQAPDRSFWVLRYPMALCCRCFGFYFGVIVFGLMAFFDKLKVKFSVLKDVKDSKGNILIKSGTA